MGISFFSLASAFRARRFIISRCLKQGSTRCEMKRTLTSSSTSSSISTSSRVSFLKALSRSQSEAQSRSSFQVARQHEPEDLIELLRLVDVLLALEQRHEDVELPVVAQPVLLQVDLENPQDGGRLKGSQPVLHERQELVFHLGGEILVADLVVLEEELFELAGGEVIEVVLDPGVHPFPELLVLAVQSFHEVVHAEVVLVLDTLEIAADKVEGLRDPGVGVPVVLLLPLHLREVPQSLDHLVVLEVLQPFEAEQDLVGREPVPVDLGGVIEEDLFALGGVPLMADAERDGDGEGDGGAGREVRRADEEPAVVLVEVPVVEGDPRLEALDLLRRAVAALDCRHQPAREGRKALQFYH